MIAAILLLMFTAGCRRGADEVISNPYLGGSKGIVATFEEFGVIGSSGMNELFEGETFAIEVRLENKGEDDVSVGDVQVTLKGISLADFTGIAQGGIMTNSEDIEGISDINRDGGESTLDFTSGTEDALYSVDLTGSFYDITVFGEIVYNYETKALVPQVCFKENLRDTSVCDVEGSKSVFSSGAPIQVISVTEKQAGTGKIALEFIIENVGSGDVSKPGVEFDTRYDQLALSVSDPGDWECKASGRLNEARLDSAGRATVLCRLKNPLAQGALFTKQVDLTLSYKYKELIQKTVRVKKQ